MDRVILAFAAPGASTVPSARLPKARKQTAPNSICVRPLRDDAQAVRFPVPQFPLRAHGEAVGSRILVSAGVGSAPGEIESSKKGV